ncbi:intracellular septation protein A [Bdellovibrio bacteriovorus]|uniref:inner membrane-spanning protein YciB n=1 Tax=Bdellovibrio bacteriovorus TaxID=959 RepID=UPI00045BE827|nr:septation protein IspZ [Bdellovibrio bacteriovorus]AHZ85191.1 intracellular septation protein [Bdellovibrio bacteriovorus]BEV69083.1 intracellular septation protein A [Bdellovibrio bacteriovorus]
MNPAPKKTAAGLFFGGLLPVIAFTLIEEYYGIIPGLIAGMIFGLGEIIWELYRHKKVQKITWIGNGMLLGLGAISLISSEGIWFKLQPAFMEGAFAIVLWGSLIVKKPLLVYLAEQQGQQFPEIIKSRMAGITFRTGVFFAIHAVLATWAALEWSTTNWALLKGLGLTVSFILYLVIEAVLLRRIVLKQRSE